MTALVEAFPERRISVSESSPVRGFILGSTELNSGKFLISVSLVSFFCRIENNDPAPHLDVYGVSLIDIALTNVVQFRTKVVETVV